MPFTTLATQVRNQLKHEQRINKVSGLDPSKLPIELRWAPPKELAITDRPSRVQNYFGLPEDGDFVLPTSVSGLADLLHSAPSGRLVILGRGGAGKTTLVTDLAIRLLDQYQDGDPVPVVFRLSSWDQYDEMPLIDWMEQQLVQDYPYLKFKRRGHPSLARQLLMNGRLLLPILDGCGSSQVTVGGVVSDLVGRCWCAREGLLLVTFLVV